MPDSSDPSAILAGIRERNSTASTYDTWHLVGRDVSRLLKAVEAALKLVDDWNALWPCSAQLREAITSALTGTQLGEDGENR